MFSQLSCVKNHQGGTLYETLFLFLQLLSDPGYLQTCCDITCCDYSYRVKCRKSPHRHAAAERRGLHSPLTVVAAAAATTATTAYYTHACNWHVSHGQFF